MKKLKTSTLQKIIHGLSITLIGIVHLIAIYIIFSTRNYASLNQSIYLKAIAITILLLIIIDVLYFAAFKFKDHLFQIIGTVLAVILLFGFGYTFTVVNRVNNVVDEVTSNSGTKQYETLVVSYVTYDNKKITKLEDVSDKKVGVLRSTSETDVATLGKQYLEDEGVSYDLVEFDKLNDLFLALISKEIDCAILPGNYYDTFNANEGYEEYLTKTASIASFTKEVEMTDNESANKDITTEPFNVLLIGYAPEAGGGGLGDSMIVASVNPKTMEVSLVSVARDSFVPIACYSGNAKDKLTHARAISRECTINTIENLLDINIDFYAEINFEGVVDIVDALDGIWIESPVEFVGQSSSSTRGEMTVWVNEGGQWANGEQALAFARERHHMPNGDMDRQLHQQEVISQIVSRTLELKDVNKMLDVMSAAGSNIKTNMGTNQIVSLLKYFTSVNYSNKLDIMNVIDITNSRVTGYSSWTYNEGMQLPLWCYPLWQGSLKDNEYLIDLTLGTLENPEYFYGFQYDSSFPYYPPTFLKTTYDEKQIHEDLPAFMQKFVGENISTVRTWCSENNVSLNEVAIRVGDAEYKEEYANGQVLEQSVKYGVKASNIDVLTIKYVQKVDPEDLVPDFTTKSYNELLTWANKNSISLNVTWITSNDSNYNASKAGTCAGDQSAKAKTLNEDVKTMSISVYDYPYVSGLSAIKTESALLTWAKNNLVNETNLKITYVYGEASVAGQIKEGSVVWSNPTGAKSDTKVKSNSIITAKVYKNDDSLVTKYTVIFKDINGATLKTEEVIQSKAATAPTPPTVEGKHFVRWDKAYTNVQSDLVVNAVYENDVVDPTPTPVPPTPEPTVAPTPVPPTDDPSANTDPVVDPTDSSTNV